MVTCEGKAGSLRSHPNQNAIFDTEVGGGIQLFTRHNDADNRFASLILNLHILLIEGNLHSIVLHLVVDNGSVIDMSVSDSSRLGFDNKEVLEGLGTVYREGEVCKVVAKLHRLIMYAIYPTA